MQTIFWVLLSLCPQLLLAEGFIAGTLVSTPSGLRAIETLIPGDQVISRTLLGKPTAANITNVTSVQTKNFMELVIEGQRYFVDLEQKFYLEGKYRSRPAHELIPGDILVGVHGQRACIEKVYFWHEETPIELYALSVARYHNFCISHNELVTHNMDVVLEAQKSALILAAGGGLILSSPAVLAIEGGCLLALGINMLVKHFKEKNRHKPCDGNKKSNSGGDQNKNSPQPPPDPKKDNNDKNNKEKAAKLAKELGFRKTNYRSHGQTVFQKGNRFITRDIDAHNGGFWKVADSVENLASKQTRLGTYDQFLNRIGD